MKKFFLTLTGLFFLFNVSAISQPRGVRGFIYDFHEQKPLPSAHVILSTIPLNDFPFYTTTNDKGYFEFRRVPPGKYLIEVTFLGFEKFIDTFQVTWSGKNFDTIYLKQSFINLKEIYVTDKIPPVEQKGDTLEFNAAAFKTSPNATLEDLILKLPGVEREENVIKIQGEEVKRILVDGRRFFGNDPEIVLRNLPADIVERLQLFDKRSEQAELTGFDDEQTEKTFNVITRVEKRKGLFGKFYGGYGSTNRFNTGINFNSFDANERISVLGIANNVNQAGFTGEDLFSAEQFTGIFGRRGQRGRGGRNERNPLLNIPINLNEGNNNVYAGGINYSNVLINSLDLTGSYFANELDNRNNTNSFRKYISELSELDSYSEKISSNGKNYNHRINVFAEYRPDSNNIFRIEPTIQFTDNKNHTASSSENYLTNLQLLNSNYFERDNQISNLDISNSLVYTHRFNPTGRTLSLSLNTSYGNRSSEYDLFTVNNSKNEIGDVIDSLKQSSDYKNIFFTSSISLVFTERIGEHSLLRLRFNPIFTTEERKRNAYNSESSSTGLILYDSLLSNYFDVQNRALRGSISYRYRSENFNFSFDLMLQNHLRKGIQKFPQSFETRNSFNAVLPSFELNYQLSEFERLRINYETRAQIPSINQLQNTIDFSNPNFLRTGNPELNKVISNSLRFRYFITNPQEGRFNAYTGNINYSIDNISNNTIVFTRDTILQQDLIVTKGTQLSYPVNVGNALSISLNAVNSFRIKLLKSNISFSTGISFNNSPSLINGRKNITRQYGVSESISLSSNDPELDYRISYTPGFTYSENSLNKKITRIITQRFNINLRAMIIENLYFGTRLDYHYNSNTPDEEDKSFIICNLGLSYLFLPAKAAEIKFEVIDLLNQRKSTNRIIANDYFEDRTTQKLERFFILTFTYNLRMFR